MTVATSDLVRAAEAAARITPAKPEPPILTGVLLRGTADGITVSGGLWIGVIRTVRGSGGPLPDVVVDARLLRDVVRLHDPTAPTTLHLAGSRLTVTQRRSAELPILPVEDFPRPPAPPARDRGYRLRAERLRALARTVAPYARDLSRARPRATAVHLRITGTPPDAVLRAVGTDRYRLAVADEPVAANGDAQLFGVLVPAAALGHAAAMVDAADELSVSVGDDQRLWICGPVGALHTDLAAGERVPDEERLLATVSAFSTVVDRDVLLTELRALSVAAADTGPIRVIADGDTLHLEAGNADGVVIRSRVAAAGDDTPRSVAVSPSRLRDAVRSFPPGPVAIAFGSDAPLVCVTRPGDPRLRHLLAPIRV